MSLRALRKQLGPRVWPCALALFELDPFHPKWTHHTTATLTYQAALHTILSLVIKRETNHYWIGSQLGYFNLTEKS